jgi:hypothetical protein
MNARVCKRLRRAVWGPRGEENRQHYAIAGGMVCICDDLRRRYQSFKRDYLSFPWNQRHTAFTVRKPI